MAAGQQAESAAQWTGQEFQQGYQASQPYMAEIGNDLSAVSNDAVNVAGSLIGDIAGMFS